MSVPELVVDPNIRLWVVVPIVAITFFIGLARHFAMQLIKSPPSVDLDKAKNNMILARARLLRSRGKFIPKRAFLARKFYFNDKEEGVLRKKAEALKEDEQNNPMGAFDENMMSNMLKANVFNMLPMMVVGGLVGWAFSGFIIIRVPFPLTMAFKPMLQRGIALATLNASWVSSMSFYFICVFGLRSIYTLILGENVQDDTAVMHQQMSLGGGPQGPQQLSKLFEQERDALEITHHEWDLQAQGANYDDDLALAVSGSELSGVEQMLLTKVWRHQA